MESRIWFLSLQGVVRVKMYARHAPQALDFVVLDAGFGYRAERSAASGTAIRY